MNDILTYERTTLIKYLKEHSLSNVGSFNLASGGTSSVYVDAKKAAQHKDVIKLLARLLCAKMEAVFGEVDTVAGVVLGGCHLASIVSMQSSYPVNVAFVRQAIKDHGTQQLVEAPRFNTSGMGERAILLEDTITTGKSAIKAAKILEAHGYDVLGILAIVDRRENKAKIMEGYQMSALVDFEELV